VLDTRNIPLKNPKTNADPVERIKFYQTRNLWQDQLAFLVELKRDRPNDPEVTNLWKQTLKSVNLDESIAANPLLP